MDFFKNLDLFVNILGNIFTIIASGIAIYLFFLKKDKIIQAFKLILNYTLQLTLTDLKLKTERLEKMDIRQLEQKDEAINIMNEIEGQISGNKILKDNLSDVISRISILYSDPKLLNESSKRNLVSLIKESIRSFEIDSLQKIINKD